MNRRRIKIKNRQFEYVLRKRRGMRAMRLAVYPDGAFVVTAPKWYPIYAINRFLAEKADWIYEKLKHVDFSGLERKKTQDRTDYKNYKTAAGKIICSRLEFFNRHYGFHYGRVSIKNQKTCWGSCSAKKNLNFSYKVAGLPGELRDYVIVHELCHLQELNHGDNFWRLVGETLPDYKKLKAKLRKHKHYAF